MPPAQTKPQGLDPDVVNLTKAIRQTESGGNFTAKGKSGEYGAYQYTEPTWNADSKAAGINVPLTQATPEQQNQVAYTKVASLKSQGNNVGQVASIWNSGKPDAYLDSSYKGTNSYGAGYDVPAYAKSVASAYQTIKSGGQVGLDPNNPSSVGSQVDVQPESPSLGGFGMNVLKSGANFAGNLGNAIIHPIQTLQNIGSAATGGLQELGGQTNENTQAFDNLKNYFIDRYKSPDALLQTAYSDPVGLAADISTIFGGAAGAAGLVSKGAKIAGLADVAETAGGVARGLNKASEISNPLTPIIKGTGALLKAGSGTAKNIASQFTEISPQGMQDIFNHPQDYTPEQIANTSRMSVAQDVEKALQSKISELSDTGSGYSPYRETPSPIKVEPDFLDKMIRETAKVDVVDGVIKPTASSVIRTSADIGKLQGLYNLYKPEFLGGTMDSNKFLNLRSDLADMAYNELGLKNTKLSSTGEGMRSSLNKEYRTQVKGLEEKDAEFSAQKEELKALRKGFIDKEGNLTQAAIAKIANAGNKDLDLQRLEQISPGITRRLVALKVMKEIEGAAGIKVGAYTKSVLEGGGIVTGLATGNLGLVAGSIALAMLTSPKVVVPLIQFLGDNKELIPLVMANLAKYATGASNLSQATSQTSAPKEQTPGGKSLSPQDGDTSGIANASTNDITQIPGYQEAITAGYTDDEIRAYLAQNQ